MGEQESHTNEPADAARSALSAVIQLSSGVRPRTGGWDRIVFVESADHLARGRSLRGANGLVLSPGADADEDGVLAYEGSLSEPGDELLVTDQLFIYTQDYLATPFLAVAGPTIVRIGSGEDYDGFLQDAELARGKGVFVEQLLQPGVFLADQCALGTTHRCGGSSRLHVTASGEVRNAPGGRGLGTVTSDPDSLLGAADASMSREGCLDAVVDPAVLADVRARLPWLSRYLRAVDVLRDLRTSGREGFAVSGFGGRLTTGLPAGLEEPVDAPLLLWSDEEYLVCDLAQERVFRLGPDAARIFEIVLVTGSADEATELACAHLGLDRDTAEEAITLITTRFADAGVPAAGVPA
jgi:hypothetical protein